MTAMFTEFDARYTEFQANTLARMVASLTGSDDAYKWPAPKTFEGNLGQLRADWAAKQQAIIDERDKENQEWFEDAPEEFRRVRPNLAIVDGKVVPEANPDEQNVLVLLRNVTEADLLRAANAGAKAVEEWLRDEGLFAIIDGGDRFSSSSLGELTRKAFDKETAKIVAGYKAA